MMAKQKPLLLTKSGVRIRIFEVMLDGDRGG